MKDEEKLPSRKRANTSLEKEKREKQKLTKKKKKVMEKTMKKENKKLLSLKAGYNQHASLPTEFLLLLLCRFPSRV